MSDRFPSGNLGDIICRQPGPDAAYVDLATGRAFSLPELDRLAARLAGGLAARFARGSCVGVIARNGTPFTLLYLSLMRAGLVAVPLSYRMPRETLAFMLADSGCLAAFVADEFRALAPEDLPCLPMDQDSLDALMAPEGMEPIHPGPKDWCEILYTSGSTGRPKGVPLSHAGQLWALERFLDATGPAPERTLIAAPAYHMNGLFFTTVALALGWRTYSVPAFDARQFLEITARERLTCLSGIPTMLAMMAREEDLLVTLDLNSVTKLAIGSAPLTEALIDRVKLIFPAAEMRNSYGTTESGPAVFGPHPEGKPRPPLALGYPYPGAEWRLVGGTADQGVLHTRTPAVTEGYLNLPEVSATRLHDGWYDSGDIVRRDADGFFHFVGRADDMFVCGGENIYPGEVEKLLERHPAVLQAAVIPADDEIKGAIPIAFVVTVPGATVSAADVRSFALANGPAYAHPRAVLFVDALPVGGTHKVDRKALVGQAAAAAAALNR
jgi:acyl-CoA synthetase (AMP-forming)/AMP-acid ligase II